MSMHQSQACQIQELVARDGEHDVSDVDVLGVSLLVEETSVLRVLRGVLFGVETTSTSESVLLSGFGTVRSRVETIDVWLERIDVRGGRTSGLGGRSGGGRHAEE
jgi:hypothetical protein